MSCAESSDGERAVSPTAAATVRERRRLRLLKRRWNHGAISNNNIVNNNSGMVLSFSAFRRARRVRNQRRMTKEEYLRLKNMVPAVATQPRVSKVKEKKKYWNLIEFYANDEMSIGIRYSLNCISERFSIFFSYELTTFHLIWPPETGASNRRSHQIYRFSPRGPFSTSQSSGVGLHHRLRHHIQWVSALLSFPSFIFWLTVNDRLAHVIQSSQIKVGGTRNR